MEMGQSKPSQFTEEIRKIVDQQNYLGLTSVISKFIRSLLNLHLQPLLVEREKLRSEIQNLKADDTGKDEMLQKVQREKDVMVMKI
jgi:hypothetical protein